MSEIQYIRELNSQQSDRDDTVNCTICHNLVDENGFPVNSLANTGLDASVAFLVPEFATFAHVPMHYRVGM